MKRIYFFCDSQMNILTAYFMMRVYYEKVDCKKILLVSNNSEKSIACANRAVTSGLWTEVDIVEEAFQGEEELIRIRDNYKIEQEDIVHLFALQNRFARALYMKAWENQSRILIVDEGVMIFKNFLEWQKNNPNEMFANIDVVSEKVEAWCYEPAIFALPPNVQLNKIELREYLQDKLKCKLLQDDVKRIFDVKEEPDIQIIYFDQYYSLNGRTIGEIEKYWIEKIAWLCDDLNFVIKPHPMERGFINKYEDIGVKIISSKDSPWEAIYFVNYYKKRDKKIICLSGESTAMATPLIMYGDTNYYIVLLRKIFNRYMRSHEWMLEGYFEGLKKIPFGRGQHLYSPNDFKEFYSIIRELTESSKEKLISDIDNRLIEKLSKDILDNRPSYFLCTLQMYKSGNIIKSIVAEQVIYDEDFELKYDFMDLVTEKDIFFRWIPCGNCFIALKDVFIEVHTLDEKDSYNIEHLVAEQPTKILEDGFVENISINPSYLLKISTNEIRKVIIRGKWKLDFNKKRLINAIEQDWVMRNEELKERLNEVDRNWKIQYHELEEKLNEKNSFIRLERERYEEMTEKEKSKNIILNDKILAIENSASWKLTMPLRKISRILKK